MGKRNKSNKRSECSGGIDVDELTETLDLSLENEKLTERLIRSIKAYSRYTPHERMIQLQSARGARLQAVARYLAQTSRILRLALLGGLTGDTQKRGILLYRLVRVARKGAAYLGMKRAKKSTFKSIDEELTYHMELSELAHKAALDAMRSFATTSQACLNSHCL
ncbi:hypothetical protein IE81DRAFT_348207 [Ceraceosorus guamensis]|uniref:Uncharacterized protein n=1 Tax=Ceraceosorus guamensis TaxID=1522189 RepID=A0A316VVX3_9BASI|nr:hypothetical protein IE81DRAFT_348207 [Ceraceosorus guamensis]PWN41640.1 hypothetical protein IE81DRAFT_348207 [Ceraceosorus guamensis]